MPNVSTIRPLHTRVGFGKTIGMHHEFPLVLTIEELEKAGVLLRQYLGSRQHDFSYLMTLFGRGMIALEELDAFLILEEISTLRKESIDHELSQLLKKMYGALRHQVYFEYKATVQRIR